MRDIDGCWLTWGRARLAPVRGTPAGARATRLWPLRGNKFIHKLRLRPLLTVTEDKQGGERDYHANDGNYGTRDVFALPDAYLIARLDQHRSVWVAALQTDRELSTRSQ